MHSDADIARALAAAFVAGVIEVDGLFNRGADLLGRRWRWLRPLARRVCGVFEGRPRPRQITVTQFILGDHGFRQACEKHELRLVDRLAAHAGMSPVAAATAWNLPSIHTPGELADWLGMAIGDLEWFADRCRLEYKRNQGRLRHYHYRALFKRFGRVRLVEAPKPRLKEIQRRILADILECVPVHAAAHGFRRGRSIKSFAASHVSKQVVVRIDLQDFFPTISAAQIQGVFRTIGYPECVADLLAGLCTNSTPSDVWRQIPMARVGNPSQNPRFLYSKPHLPQGAPTSPALANLCAYRMDCRLSGLATSAQAIYTRYGDDLAFSGDRAFHRVVKRFCLHVCATVMEEGFSIHYRKTRIMQHGVRQRLAGIVVNERLNVTRTDYDRLKATLTNCIRHGASSQNRAGHRDFQAHLLGRISFVEMVNRTRGRRLHELFDKIHW
jgi:RNA-directed DNA polymerase